MQAELEKVSNADKKMPGQLRDCFSESLMCILRLVEARTNFIAEKKQEIEKSQEKDEEFTSEIVVRKDQ